MEFEYSGTIYVDIDKLVKDFIEDDWDDVWDFINHWGSNLNDRDYYHIESWMIDAIVAKMKEYEAVKAKIKDV